MINAATIREEANRISELNNPFFKDKIIAFRTYCNKSMFSANWTYAGCIEFQNGNTKGIQEFEADDFAGLLKKMETFMAELEGENDKTD